MTDKNKIPDSLKKKIADAEYQIKLENLAKHALTREPSQPVLIFSDMEKERDIREKPIRQFIEPTTGKHISKNK